MFDIVTKANAINIKSLTWVCDASGSNTIYIYRRKTFGSYSSVASTSSAWETIVSGTMTCQASTSNTNVGGLINTIYIPAYTTLGIYIKIGNKIQYNRDNVADIIGDDIDIKVGIGVDGTFGSATANREFIGYVHYEIIDCYLNQLISGPGTYTLNGMTSEEGHQESSPIGGITQGSALYLCFNIDASFSCFNPSISAKAFNTDYNGVGDNWEYFRMSVVDGTDNGIDYNICLIDDESTNVCTGYISCPSQTLGSGASITQSNGNIVIRAFTGNGVDASCTAPELGQTINVDVSITCEITPTAVTQTPTKPTSLPTQITKTPTLQPSTQTSAPSRPPTTTTPTKIPSITPSKTPTTIPTLIPTQTPSSTPSTIPSTTPSNIPTSKPTDNPIITNHPTSNPTSYPSITPTQSTITPSQQTSIPSKLTLYPSKITHIPTKTSTNPTINTLNPSTSPTKKTIKQSFIPFISKDQEIFLLIIMGITLICCLCLCFVIIYYSKKSKKQARELKEARIAAEMTQIPSVSRPDLTATTSDEINGSRRIMNGSITTMTKSSQISMGSQKYFIDTNNVDVGEGASTVVDVLDTRGADGNVTRGGDDEDESELESLPDINDSDDELYKDTGVDRETTRG